MKPNQSTSELLPILLLALLTEKASADTRKGLVVAEVSKSFDAQYNAWLDQHEEDTQHVPAQR